MTQFVAIALAIVLLVIVGLRMFCRLPSKPDGELGQSVSDRASPLIERAEEVAGAHGGSDGIGVLPDGLEAFALRLEMTRAATRSIDAQYYIWEGDLSGRMLLCELAAAADRGVRVRILIDDNPTAGLDEMWSDIDSHPNISVRLFNPLVIRRFRSLNYLFDFFRLNRRMHNKSMTFDGAVSILGGRNIGDAYFGAGDHGLFIDLDTYVVGPVVGDVAAQFERYWNSDPAYPAVSIIKPSREPILAT